MMIKEINVKEFDNEIAEGVVLVDFHARWCEPCKMLSAILEEVQSELEGQVKVLKVNVEKNMKTAQKYLVINLPAMIIFKNGEEVERLVGFMPKQTIREVLNKYL